MPQCNMCRSVDVRVCIDGPGTWHCYEPSAGPTFSYQVAVCLRCGHVFGHWDRDRTVQYIDEEYVTCDGDLEQYTVYVPFVLAGVPQQTRRPRILEIGFNRGSLLKHFYELGFECHGVEPGPQNVEAARQKMPDAHLDAGLFDAQWAKKFVPQSFDVVMLTSVFEHMPDPADVLRAVRPLLKPDGRLFLLVPDLCFYAPTYQIPRGPRDRYGCSQFLFFYRNLFLCYAQHVNHFSTPSLTRYLAALGFQTTQIANIGNLWTLSKPAEPVNPTFEYPDLVEFHLEMMAYYEELLEDIRRSVVAKLRGRRVVCFGAGRDFGYFMDVFAPLGVKVLAVSDDRFSDGIEDAQCRDDVVRVPPEEIAKFTPDICIATSFDHETDIAAKARALLSNHAVSSAQVAGNPAATRGTEVVTLTELLCEHAFALPQFTSYAKLPVVPIPGEALATANA